MAYVLAKQKKIIKTFQVWLLSSQLVKFSFCDKEIQGIISYRVPEELGMEVPSIVQEAVTKTIPMKKKCKKAEWLSEEALQIAEKRREVRGKGEKCRVPKITRRDKKAFLSYQCKK